MKTVKRLEEILKRVKELQGKSVVVGIPKNTVVNQMDMCELGMVHEFGATIQHAGGTSYGYKNKRDANKGKVRFLKNGAKSYSVMGKTTSHTIQIPERSFLRSTFAKEKENLGSLTYKVFKQALKGDVSAHDAYKSIGAYMSNQVKETMTDGDLTPLKPETIKRKGSSKPLIDTGQLRASITYEVRDES